MTSREGFLFEIRDEMFNLLLKKKSNYKIAQFTDIHQSGKK